MKPPISFAAIFIALLVSMVFGFLLLFELHFTPILAGILTLGIYLGLSLIFEQRGFLPSKIEDVEKKPLSQIDILLEESHPHIKTLLENGGKIGGQAGLNLLHMAQIATDISEKLKADPDKLQIVLRLFTYYLPETAELAKARIAATDDDQITSIDEMLNRLNNAYMQFQSAIDAEDSDELRIDLELLDKSLRDDIKTE